MIICLDGLNKQNKIQKLIDMNIINYDNYLVYNYLPSFISHRKQKNFIYGEYYSIVKTMQLWLETVEKHSENINKKHLIVKHFPFSEFCYASLNSSEKDIDTYKRLIEFLFNLNEKYNNSIFLYLYYIKFDKSTENEGWKNYAQYFLQTFNFDYQERWDKDKMQNNIADTILKPLNELFLDFFNNIQFNNKVLIS